MFHFPVPPRPPAHHRMPHFVWGAGIFTDEELRRIEAYAKTLPPQQARGGDKAGRPERSRFVDRLLLPTAETVWIYQKIATAAAMLNAQHYKFDVTGMDEPLHHVTYLDKDNGYSDWHADVSDDGRPTRKLSITFQVSDPKDYDGGDLELDAEGLPQTCPRERGTLILFPSFRIHRITPVTRGTRTALVAWIVGPPLR